MDSAKRLDTLIRHITNVQSNCTLLGERLIENGKEGFGRKLISNGFIHDHSKFSGIEWDYLHQDVKDNEPEKFKMAALQHVHTNKHHPEYWGGIREMPSIYLAEAVCDWKARSSEFGDDLREWIKKSATDKYEFSISGMTYKEIKLYVDLLLDPSFK